MKRVLPYFIAALLIVFAAYKFSSTKVLGVSTTVTAGPTGLNGLRAYPGPGRGEVTLEWSRASVNAESYSIHYGSGSGYYQFLASHVGNIATYTVRGLTPGQRYYFGLERIWIGDASQGISGEVVATAPTTPVTVIGTAGPVGRNVLTGTSGPQVGQVTLKWRRFFTDTVGYSVVYGDFPGQYVYGANNAIDASNVSQNDFSFTVSSLKSGHRYYFAIVPVRSSTGGAYTTAEVSVVSR